MITFLVWALYSSTSWYQQTMSFIPTDTGSYPSCYTFLTAMDNYTWSQKPSKSFLFYIASVGFQFQLRAMFLTLPMSVFFFFVDCIPSCKGIGKVFACGLVPKPKRCSTNSLEILQEGSAWHTSNQRRKPVAKKTINALFSVLAWLYYPCCLHWSK